MKKLKPLDIIMLIILVLSIGIFLYPFVQNELNTFIDQKVITHYQEQANKENDKERQKMQEENKKLASEKSDPGLSSFNQAVNNSEEPKKKAIDYYQTHTIGVLYIPSIKVKLPIFDVTNDVLLQRGASLLEGSSFPAEGESVHSVISAHRGLPEAKLFSDLPKMEIGDSFFIDINGERLAYEVIETKVIEPTDTGALTIKEDQNLVTLLTCTPYMINTHRLLVTGKKVPYIASKDQKKIDNISTWEKYRFLGIAIASVLLIVGTLFILWSWYKNLLISKRNYTLSLTLLNKRGEPLKNQCVLLRPKNKNKKNITLSANDKGMIKAKNIPGGIYSLSLSTGKYKKAQPLKVKVKKIKDTTFSLSTKNKKQKYQITILSKDSKNIVTYRKNRKKP